MANEMTNTLTDLFKQATETFQSAVQTGTKLQQETLKAWTGPVCAEVCGDDIRDRGRKMSEESIKLMQRNLDESTRLLDTQCKQSLDLLRKAFDSAKGGEKADLFEQTRNMWQDSLDALRGSAQHMAKANSQFVENWSNFLTQSFNGHEKKPAAAKSQ
jgi:hypothetical protein